MTNIHEILKNRDLQPQFQILNNEYSALIKQCFKDEKITYQLDPSDLYRNNAAEKVIGPFKDHLIAIICSCDPHFPIHLWCCLILNATTTLNLLWQYHINPSLLAEV